MFFGSLARIVLSIAEQRKTQSLTDQRSDFTRLHRYHSDRSKAEIGSSRVAAPLNSICCDRLAMEARPIRADPRAVQRSPTPPRTRRAAWHWLERQNAAVWAHLRRSARHRKRRAAAPRRTAPESAALRRERRSDEGRDERQTVDAHSRITQRKRLFIVKT